MTYGPFKDPVSQVHLAGTATASWSLTQEVAGLNSFIVMTNIFVTEFSETFRTMETLHWRILLNTINIITKPDSLNGNLTIKRVSKERRSATRTHPQPTFSISCNSWT